MTFAAVEVRRRCKACNAPSNRCPCRHCHSCTTSGGEPGVACACGTVRLVLPVAAVDAPPRPRRRAFDAAELARAHMLAEALHPDGHCTCGGGGGGSCEWCRSHCLFCGCAITGAYCAACGQEAVP